MSPLVILFQIVCISLAVSQPQLSNNLERWSFIVTPSEQRRRLLCGWCGELHTLNAEVHNLTLPSSTPWMFTNQPTVIRHDDYTCTPGIGCHKFHTRALTWHGARQTCADEDGHLAIINSMAEANVITGLFQKAITGEAYPHGWAFIGFHDLFQEGEYVTVLDQSLAKAGYTQWFGREPTIVNSGRDEDCGSVNKLGGLNDITCSEKYGFVCELPIH